MAIWITILNKVKTFWVIHDPYLWFIFCYEFPGAVIYDPYFLWLQTFWNEFDLFAIWLFEFWALKKCKWKGNSGKGSIGEKHINTEKLNSENNNTKIEENGTESEKDKTDFA
jgi:hypothetical protein